MAPPKTSGKLDRTKGKGTTTVKFNLGVKALIRSVSAAHGAASRAVDIGEKKLAAAKKSGNKAAIQANRVSLGGAKSAKREFANALKTMEAIDCTDQFMNCDPEFL
jgi:hypothetical protein